ncbi:MAG: hypothetical protein LPK85_05140 [Gammaproteobacteria bacterium]|nr:hypothetical protein [Gammaproteobacteria bacterium]
MRPGIGPVEARVIEVGANGMRLEVDFLPNMRDQFLVRVTPHYAGQTLRFICRVEVRHVVVKGSVYHFGALIVQIDEQPSRFLTQYAMEFI